ncbi:MAG TPA: DNA replication/repair protein RecF [Epulopiscium sp.]|nr:DNA replication/repair protein RecF [Candidatus Epulonipiscium sp.]
MYIRELSLQNFRNYNYLNLVLHPGINVFVGDNAQGKTNVLEAIYLCATARSHRTNQEKEVIAWDETEAHIRLDIKKRHIEDQIDFHMDRKGKGVAINRIPIRRLGELLGVLNVVMFSPEDLQMIKRGPGERRRFIDIELCQIDRMYYYGLQQYHKVLKQRNNLLKSFEHTSDAQNLLEVWDTQIVEYGTNVINKRINFVDKLEKIAQEIHFNISGDKEKLEIRYDPSVNVAQYETKLSANHKRDIFRRSTSLGPHRDDLVFLINEMDVRTYGSQGQQRTVVLSIKLAQLRMIQEILGEQPVLLLDDVLSELDYHRQQFLFAHTQNIQTLITCTGIEESVWNSQSIGKLFKVNKGTIR